MVSYQTRTALDDMEGYIIAAKILEEEGLSNRVVATQYIMAAIRGNDAMCFKHMRRTPQDHDKAASMFKRLYEDHHIDEKYSKYYSNISNIISKKSDIQYRPENLSKSELEKLKKQAERFIKNTVRELVDVEE